MPGGRRVFKESWGQSKGGRRQSSGTMRGRGGLTSLKGTGLLTVGLAVWEV